MEDLLLSVIIIIVVLDFIWEQILNFLNRTKMSPDIPAELMGIYDNEQYARQQAYQKTNSRLDLISGSFLFIIILGMLIFHGFGYLDGLLRQITENFILLPLLYLGIITLVLQIISFPFEWYDTFVIEERYGFNRSSKSLFIIDFFKKLLLTFVMGGVILAIILYIYKYTEEWFWIFAWIIISLFSVFMSILYSKWIVPLFNKQRKLHSGELRQKIETFAWNAGFEMQDIYILDGSKRSTKANAYFTGLGKKKRIVLFDTLIKELEPDEVLAVLAHEIGHYRKKHIQQSLVMSIISTGVILFILSLLLNNPMLSKALGSDIPSFHLGLVGFSFLFSPISGLIGLLFNHISRKNEYEADAFVKKYNLKDALIRGLIKSSIRSLSNLTPHPWMVFCHYSHPTLLQRIHKLKNRQENC
ncbi:MAG: M48 family metallopeptidase [Candidatus Azobacteroides sp.]|nr:M48 family metallopeptidase [Candidatus Azobacteroides sp.]